VALGTTVGKEVTELMAVGDGMAVGLGIGWPITRQAESPGINNKCTTVRRGVIIVLFVTGDDPSHYTRPGAACSAKVPLIQ
jgi:hypothetical protein